MSRSRRKTIIVIIGTVILGCFGILTLQIINLDDLAVKISDKSGSFIESTILTSDGSIRDCITGDVIARFSRDAEVVRSAKPESQDQKEQQSAADTRDKMFQKVFNDRLWGTTNETNSGLSASGPGSTPSFAIEAMATLHTAINELKRQLHVPRIRLLDMPCGDMAWMSRFLEARTDVDYTGIDIVPQLIENHQRVFVNRATWNFQRRDFVSDDEIEYEKFHLIHVRMVLQHLPLSAVMRFLSRLSADRMQSNVTSFLLTTTFPTTSVNAEVQVGEFRHLNLEVPPASLTPPLCLINDGQPEHEHYLGLWKLPLQCVPDCDGNPNRSTVKRSSVLAFGSQRDFFSCIPWSVENKQLA